jgi:hypothetical protein
LGVPGFVLEHLKLGNVRDVLDTCGIAQAPNKIRKIVAKTIRNHAAWRMAADKATRYDAKRQLTYQATNDGVTGGQELDRLWAITTSQNTRFGPRWKRSRRRAFPPPRGPWLGIDPSQRVAHGLLPRGTISLPANNAWDSEQRPAQSLKYRLAIEPIAACYTCFLVLPSRVVHSEKLSKSKPFGILRLP